MNETSTSERAMLQQLAQLMNWPQWVWAKGDAGFPTGVTFWADLGYSCGILVYRPDEQNGVCWNPLTSNTDAIELAEHLSRDETPYTLEVVRTYEQHWRVGPPGWAALFISRFAHVGGDQVEDRCLEHGVWAPTFARAVSLAALKAKGQ